MSTTVPTAPLHHHEVPEGAPAERLDRYASRAAGFFASTAQAHRAAKKGDLRLNDEVVSPDWRVKPGDVLSVAALHGAPRRVYELPLAVVFEDGHLAVVEKPAGVLVNGNRHRTVERALPFNLTPSDQPDALTLPRPVHRLDVPTAGLLLVAKTSAAAADLGRQLAERQVQKRYRAVVEGILEGEGRVDSPLDGRSAATRYAVVCNTRAVRSDWVTTVDLWPETGRTHQLRRHMAELGHPILGDATYGVEGAVLRRSGLFLRAVALRFTHPHTGAVVDLSIPEPPRFESYRRREALRWARLTADPALSR